MKKWSTLLVSVVTLALLMTACAPGTAPAPATSTPAATLSSPAATPTSNLSLPTSQDAWAKVVEAAKAEGQINVYTWGWTGDVGVNIARAFENRYGIKLNIITGRGAEFIERLKTEARMGQMTADFWEGAATHSQSMKQENLLVSAGDLPILRQKDAFSADPYVFASGGEYLLENQFYQGLHVNTNLVKPGEEPKAWVDLLDPKWKGKIILSDPLLSVNTSYFAILIDQKRLTLDFMEKLGKQNLLFDPSSSGVAIRLARGDAALGITTASDSSGPAQEGAPIKLVDTKEGIWANGQAVGMVKGGPHPNAAKLLVNWILSQEGQDVYCKSKGVLSVRKDVPDYQPPAIRLSNPQYPVFVTPEYNDLVARVFRDKQYVSLLKPK